jgi:hypothetical protein
MAIYSYFSKELKPEIVQQRIGEQKLQEVGA